MRRNDVASTSFRRRVPIRFLINQCQIITFLILKYDMIENSRIELRGIVLPVQMGGLLGGPKGMLAPPLKLLGGAGPPWPPTLFLRLCTIICYNALYTRTEVKHYLEPCNTALSSIFAALLLNESHLFHFTFFEPFFFRKGFTIQRSKQEVTKVVSL